MRVSVYVWMYLCMWVCTHACMYMCPCIHVYMCVYTCLYVFMYTCMYTCLYVCMYYDMITYSATSGNDTQLQYQKKKNTWSMLTWRQTGILLDAFKPIQMSTHTRMRVWDVVYREFDACVHICVHIYAFMYLGTCVCISQQCRPVKLNQHIHR